METDTITTSLEGQEMDLEPAQVKGKIPQFYNPEEGCTGSRNIGFNLFTESYLEMPLSKERTFRKEAGEKSVKKEERHENKCQESTVTRRKSLPTLQS